MRFQVTAEHIKKQNLKSTLFAFFLFTLSVACIGALISAKSLPDVIFPVIGLLLFVPPVIRIFRIMREGAGSYPVVELNEDEGKIAVSHRDVVATVDVTQIKNLRLQYKSKVLVSAIVTTNSGEVMRFEGYEDLDGLASTLARLTPTDRVTHASFYHC